MKKHRFLRASAIGALVLVLVLAGCGKPTEAVLNEFEKTVDDMQAYINEVTQSSASSGNAINALVKMATLQKKVGQYQKKLERLIAQLNENNMTEEQTARLDRLMFKMTTALEILASSLLQGM